MPNHVTNIITLSGDKDQVARLMKAVQNDEYGLGSIDFNKIIPMPATMDIEAGSNTDRGLKAYKDFISVYTLGRTEEDAKKALKDIPIESEEAFLRQRTDIDRKTWLLGKTAWQNISRYGAPTWFEWCINNWGTKWNAYGTDEIHHGMDTDCTLAFQTAWSAPHPVIEKLAKENSDIGFSHAWADEDIGYNCGRYKYEGGVRTEEYFPETDMEGVQFAASVMDAEPCDWGLFLNRSGTEYISGWRDEFSLAILNSQPVLLTDKVLKDEDIPKELKPYYLSGEGKSYTALHHVIPEACVGTILSQTELPFDGAEALNVKEPGVLVLPKMDKLSVLEYVEDRYQMPPEMNNGQTMDM